MINKKVLSEYLKQMEDEKLSSITLSILKAGDKISSLDFLEKDGKEKNDQYLGHHAITTPADFISQDIILEYLSNKFPQSSFIAEEKTEKKGLASKILTKDNFVKNLNGIVFGVDSLDGTSQYKDGLYEWSVSVGEMEEREHKIGAIYSPKIRDGLLVFGSRGKGVHLAEGGKNIQKVSVAENKEDKKTIIQFGPDISFDQSYNKFVNNVARNSRTININGSCALGLALVAAGRVDALIQPTQRVWDWFGGYPLIEEAGGKIQFYRFKNDNIYLVDKPFLEDYNPDSKNLGFIAGNKNLVDRLTGKLTKMYGK